VTTQPNPNNRVLRLNVGFLLKESVGTTRAIPFDEGQVTVDDLGLSHLRGTLELTRTAQGILLQGYLDAETVAECVRCLSDATVPVSIELSEHFVYPPATATDGEYSVGENGLIELAPILREDAILAIPIQILCQSNCRGLCSNCGQNLNEAQCECDHSPIDPRLEVLKALLDE
jgi:uncharacterized protein